MKLTNKKIWVYDKDEADKAIAELKDELSHKTEFAIQCQMAARTLQRKLRRQKYRRCLAMAKWCENEENRLEAIAPLYDTDKECWEYGSDYWNKWHKRWLKIAEQFKEAKAEEL